MLNKRDINVPKNAVLLIHYHQYLPPVSFSCSIVASQTYMRRIMWVSKWGQLGSYKARLHGTSKTHRDTAPCDTLITSGTNNRFCRRPYPLLMPLVGAYQPHPCTSVNLILGLVHSFTFPSTSTPDDLHRSSHSCPIRMTCNCHLGGHTNSITKWRGQGLIDALGKP